MNRCPICQSKPFKVCNLRGWRTGRLSPLYFCLKCNFYYQRHDYHEDDKTLEGDLQWHIEQAEQRARRARKDLELLLKYHPNAKSLLDIGCGIGTTLRVALEYGLEAQGVEPNQYAVDYGRNQMSLDIIEGYFDAGMFSTKFDIVILYMVLEHVSAPTSLIDECFKVINPNGILFLAVPGRKGGTLRILYSLLNPRGYKSLFKDNDGHINHFSRKSIETLLRPYDCEILNTPSSGSYIIRFAGPPIE